MSRSSSLNPSAREKESQIRQILSRALEKASCSALTDDEVSTLKDMLHKTPETALEMLEPDIHCFAGTTEYNPILFREAILPLLIASPLREE
jgi:hypothetical protein